jgi:DNA-binding CsgD family transcriptional regulator
LLRARISLAREDTEAASALAMRARTEAMNLLQPVSLLAIDRFQGLLATMSDETAAASEILAQTLKIADECALPFERAETMLALIELDLAMGNEDLASQRSAVVRPMLDELEAAPALERLNSLVSPRKSRPTANRFGITQRELEVLRLLVEGRTDREIGEELFISHHTVMNHVSRILAKLDVESRTAAATAAVRNNLV